MTDIVTRLKEFENKAIDELSCVDIESLIISLGIDLDMDAVLPEGVSGQIEKLDDGRYKISADHNESLNRRRFTVAHELGHYIYHRSLIGSGVDDNKAYRSTDKGNFYNKSIGQKEETEANQFAASILMPWNLIIALEAKVREETQDADHEIIFNKVAETLKVSRQAFDFRYNS